MKAVLVTLSFLVSLSACGVVAPASSLQRCGRTDPSANGELGCVAACPADEVCNSAVSCGPPAGGVSTCSDHPDLARDERCHRTCETSADCPAGEECVEGGTFDCSDIARTVRICCAGGDCSAG